MPDPAFAPATAAGITEAYCRGRSNPMKLARRLLDALDDSEAQDPPLRALICQIPGDLLAQAEASTLRYQQATQLGPLDGVPVVVKDELHQQGYPTTVGTTFLGAAHEKRDATVVARLRAAGAMLAGKANMHEIGLGVTGINPHHGTARNPYDPGRFAGGSSSGSAAAVAAGLCPLAVAADGGGSIRIPSALCGVVGLKPTFGRLSEHGAVPLCYSVAHVGPIAATVDDLALAYGVMAGPDPDDPLTHAQPEPTLAGVGNGVDGLRVGWCAAWARQAGDEVRGRCEEAVQRLAEAGAQVREVEVAHLDLVGPVQTITIGVEMGAAQFEQHARDPSVYGADTRFLLEAAHHVRAVDYVRAQRLRAVIARAFERALADVDLLVTPTTGVTASEVGPQDEQCGVSDLGLLREITAFCFAANLTGQPALSVPVGTDRRGLPIGLQLLGRHWDEVTLLRTARVVASLYPPARPRVWFDLLR